MFKSVAMGDLGSGLMVLIRKLQLNVTLSLPNIYADTKSNAEKLAEAVSSSG